MTTSNITGVSQNQYARTEEAKGPKGPKGPKPEEGSKGPAPIVPEEKSQDTYVPSAEALATMEETAEEEATSQTTTTSSSVSSEDREAVVNQLKADLQMNEAKFVSDMVAMITGQSNAFSNVTNIWEEYEVTPEMQAEAQENIADGGYWSVEETANRIVDMAKALAGDDPEKADEMMAAIEAGFEQAEKAWGSELPSIAGDTKSAIDSLFADWVASAG